MSRRHGSRAAVFVSWLLLLVLAASGVAAQPDASASLSWEHPVGSMCPTGPMLEGDVELLLGQPVFVDEAHARVRLRGRVSDRADGVAVRLEARASDGTLLGTREMSAPAGECAGLRRALALVLTMLLDSQVPERHDARQERKRTLSAGAHALLWSGTLPWVRPGLELSLAGDLHARLRLRGYGSYVLPLSVETARGVGARFRAFQLGLAACPRLLTRDAFRVWLCSGAQLGGVSARPHALAGPSQQFRALWQLVLELSGSLKLGPKSALELALGPVLSLNRPVFSFERADGSRLRVLRPALLGAIFRLGVTIDGW